MTGLLPIPWGTGTGSEVMSRIAAPMVGGMIVSTVFNAGGDSGDLRVGQAVAAGQGVGELGTSFPAVTLR